MMGEHEIITELLNKSIKHKTSKNGNVYLISYSTRTKLTFNINNAFTTFYDVWEIEIKYNPNDTITLLVVVDVQAEYFHTTKINLNMKQLEVFKVQ